MAKATHISSADPKIFHVGRCYMDIAKALDDDAFQETFGMSKEEAGPCDIIDRSSRDYQEKEIENLGSSSFSESQKNNMPDAEWSLRPSGSNLVASCVNHAAPMNKAFKSAERTAYHLRPSLNPGESPEMNNRFARKAGELIQKSNKYWNSLVNQRSQTRFNKGVSDNSSEIAMYDANDDVPDDDIDI